MTVSNLKACFIIISYYFAFEPLMKPHYLRELCFDEAFIMPDWFHIVTTHLKQWRLIL